MIEIIGLFGLDRESTEKLAMFHREFEFILENSAGLIEFENPISLNTEDSLSPFCFDPNESAKHKKSSSSNQRQIYNTGAEKSEVDVAAELFNEDFSSPQTEMSPSVRTVYRRNVRAANKLKKLYGKCQISGKKFVFEKSNGELYLEVHHLVPLGEGGADHPANLIVVSAHIHKNVALC